MADQTYELRTASGRIVSWEGASGEDAAQRAANALHVTIVAWRPARRPDFVVGAPARIVGPDGRTPA